MKLGLDMKSLARSLLMVTLLSVMTISLEIPLNEASKDFEDITSEPGEEETDFDDYEDYDDEYDDYIEEDYEDEDETDYYDDDDEE